MEMAIVPYIPEERSARLNSTYVVLSPLPALQKLFGCRFTEALPLPPAT